MSDKPFRAMWMCTGGLRVGATAAQLKRLIAAWTEAGMPTLSRIEVTAPDIQELQAQLSEKTAALAAAEARVKELEEALREYDNDGNWLIESSYVDRPSKTGSGDMIYIGKWDPRVFASHALAGTPLENTTEEHRRKLSAFYEPGKERSYEAGVKLSLAVAALEDVAVQVLPEEYGSECGEEVNETSLAEGYELIILDARAALKKIRGETGVGGEE